MPWHIPLLAFLITFTLHLTALFLFPKLKLLDFPERYGYRRKPIPYPTGIIPVLVFLVFFCFIESWHLKSAGVVISIILLGSCSFIDDRKRLSPVLRLGLQIFIAVFLFITGTYIFSLTNPLDLLPGMPEIIELNRFIITTKTFGPLPIVSGLFTILWLLLTINALNWFDGIPGQVSILTTIGFFALGALSFSTRVNQPDIALIAFTIAGISLAGAFFDFPPAKSLIGDTGAMFYGLILGILTIYAGGKVATAFLVLGVPLIDSLLVILYRFVKGTSLTNNNTSNEHLHHRLLNKGWTERQIISLTAFLGSAFGISALFMSTPGKFISALFLFFIMLFLSYYTKK